MALPLSINTIKTGARAGQKLYRQGSRFISKAKYELEQRRGPGGRFLSKEGAKYQRNMESYLRAELGAPPAGKKWAQIAGKYPERFENYVAEFQ